MPLFLFAKTNRPTDQTQIEHFINQQLNKQVFMCISTKSLFAAATIFLAIIQACVAIVEEENIVNATARTVLISQNAQRFLRADLEATSSTLLEAIRVAGGCPRAACFALEGSLAISARRYKSQVILAALAGSIIAVDTESELAAGEYSRLVTEISSLTDDADAFVESLNNSTASARNPKFLVNGVRFCVKQLATASAERQALVVMGSGARTLGNAPTVLLERSGVSANENVTVHGVLSTFGKRPFIQNLGLRRKDVIVSRNIRMLPSALEKLVSSICDLDM